MTEAPRLTVGDLRLPSPVVLSRSASIRDAAEAMTYQRVSAVIVLGGIGTGALLTEHDLVRSLALGCDASTPAASLATPSPLTVTPSTPVVEAVETMLRHGVRHLVVGEVGGRTLAVMSLRQSVAGLLSSIEVPGWLSALRLALHVEWHEGRPGV
ncbi:MAG: CBS domain-containing protein [Acidimicrobiia bacterium]|nr:CBS domain-containing protein [Acidimicrobiia bacterium]